MLKKKGGSSPGMTMVEIVVGTLIASIVLVTITLIYYYTTRASDYGFSRGEAQKAINMSMDNLLKDLRTVGSDVSVATCGYAKEDSILIGEEKRMLLLGNFDRDNDLVPFTGGTPTPTIEMVHYVVENNICLLKQIYSQTNAGTSGWDTQPYSEKVLIGNRPTGKSRIRVAAGNGFILQYLDALQTPIPLPLTLDRQRLVRRVNITIKVTDPDGDTLSYTTNSTGMLRNLQSGEKY